jgi:Patatin-like phospholipase
LRGAASRRRVQVVTRSGNQIRLLDEVDVITGISGGSFTALAYGLYGEKMFDVYEKWTAMRELRDSVTLATNKDPKLGRLVNVPDADIYIVDVSFEALKDKAERDYFNQLPTSFFLPDEAIDRLRAAASTLILESPDFQQMLKDAGARVVDPSAIMPSAKLPASTILAPPAAKQLTPHTCTTTAPALGHVGRKNAINMSVSTDNGQPPAFIVRIALSRACCASTIKRYAA